MKTMILALVKVMAHEYYFFCGILRQALKSSGGKKERQWLLALLV